jgi:hypothetical protein
MSLAAWIPSSFRFFSICLDRALEALSSADIAQPILLTRRAATVEANQSHSHSLTFTWSHPRKPGKRVWVCRDG